jgi:hypothetical protein
VSDIASSGTNAAQHLWACFVALRNLHSLVVDVSDVLVVGTQNREPHAAFLAIIRD